MLPPGLRAGMQNLMLRDTRRLRAARTRQSSDSRKLHFLRQIGNTDNLHYFNKTKDLHKHTQS